MENDSSNLQRIIIASFNFDYSLRRTEDTTKGAKPQTQLSNKERYSKTQMPDGSSSTDPNSVQVVLKMIYII